ncbi:MAG: nucleotidyltransferase family protein, partial [Deltaproteobacteria bacterium]|nr:nucleotidyltransferase family protein [Deltaproteobacteria bacterium]
MLKLTREEEIAFLLSRLRPSDEDFECLRKLLTEDTSQVDYKRLLGLGFKNGVAPLWHKHLEAGGMVPDRVLARLRNVYLFSAASNLAKGAEMLKILDLLKTQGIQAIPLKGAVASDMIFQDAGLYYGADIDFLVRPANLEATKAILIHAGYSFFEEDMEKDWLSTHYHLCFHRDQYYVEVHWNLVKKHFHIPSDFWWEGASVGTYEGREVLCLQPEKYLMYAIFRLFSHSFQPLRFLVLISELANTYHDVIDWAYFKAVTAQYKMQKLSFFTLRLAHEFLGTKIPKEIARKRIAGYDLLSDSIVNLLFRDVKRPHVMKIKYAFLLDSFSHILLSLLRPM